jgi:hypothetical protein
VSDDLGSLADAHETQAKDLDLIVRLRRADS